MDELVDDTSSSLRGKDNIFLDGELVGTCTDPALFVTELRNMRDAQWNFLTRFSFITL